MGFPAEPPGELGIAVGQELADPVTDQALVGALNQFGTNLTTTAPERQLSRDDAARILHGFDSGLASTEAGQCPPGFPGNSCNSVKCAGGANDGVSCSSDAQCPGGSCRTPPGIAKRVGSPTGG